MLDVIFRVALAGSFHLMASIWIQDENHPIIGFLYAFLFHGLAAMFTAQAAYRYWKVIKEPPTPEP